MKTMTPDGLIGSLYELYDVKNKIVSTWLVVNAWKGDGRGRRGRRGMWRVTLAPLDDPHIHPIFQALWNDVGKHLELRNTNTNWTMSRHLA